MKKSLGIFIFWLISWFATAQVPAYYNSVDLSQTGMDLKDDLATLIISTHTTELSYTDLWNVLKQTDEVPSDHSKVFLIYGWEQGTDSDCHNDLMRDKNDNGGSSSSCEWNREHVFPRSLGTPNLGSTGAGSDAHHVRPSDVSMNSWRGSKKFIDDSGNAHEVSGSYWYPGDEWKGDVARIIMYLYLRYGSQCQPDNVGIGNPVSNDPDMIDLFLQWNAEDPPSPVEDQRNNILENIQGNRNPFIDNPYLATLIWGGPVALDRWNMSVGEERWLDKVSVYPNPVRDKLHIYSPVEGETLQLRDSTGRILIQSKITGEETEWNVEALPPALYFLYIFKDNRQGIKPVLKN